MKITLKEVWDQNMFNDDEFSLEKEWELAEPADQWLAVKDAFGEDVAIDILGDFDDSLYLSWDELKEHLNPSPEQLAIIEKSLKETGEWGSF